MLSTSEDSIETGKKGQKQPSLPLSDFNTAPEIHCKQKGNVKTRRSIRLVVGGYKC